MTTPALPPGFVEDPPPEGFVLDEPAPKKEPASKASRFVTGLFDPVYGAAQIADKYLVDPIRQKISPGASSMEDVIKARDAEYSAPEGVDWMRLGGNVVNPVNYVGGGSVGLASKVPALAKVATALPRATNVARNVAGGAFGGALQPTGEGESHLDNATVGGVISGIAPPAFKLLAKAGRGARNVAQNVAAPFSEKAARAVGTRTTAEVLARELGEDMPRTVYTRHPHIEGTPSAAVATQSPKLAGLERASRGRAGAEWQAFDEAAHKARWQALDEGLQTPDDVTALLAKADEVGAEVPYGAVKPKSFGKGMDDFYANLQRAKTTPDYLANPAVRNAVDYVERTMAEAGTVTPELLHTMRRTLAKGLTGAPGAGDAGVRAAASEPKIIAMMQAMDNVLDVGSKGKWSGWKGDYADAMTRAESAKADVNIRSRFIDPATGTPRKPVTGLDDVPVLTPQALKQAIKSAGSMTRGPKKGVNLLSTGSEDLLQGVRRDLDAQAILQRSQAAGTGGGGSTTVSNLAQDALLGAVTPPGTGTLFNVVQKAGLAKGQETSNRQLAALLQDPAALKRFLEVQQQQKLLRSGMPLLPGGGVGIGNLGAYGLSE